MATYQSVSGAGREGISELASQTAALLSGQGPVKAGIIPAQIAFNCVPQIDRFEDNGYTREEMKMVWETRRSLGAPDIRVNPTAVRVPVFFGHSEAVHLTTRRKLGAAAARKILQKAPGVTVMDDRRPGGTPRQPSRQRTATQFMWVALDDMSSECGLNLWIVADNVRKGAATNSVQIAEILARDYYKLYCRP